MPKRVLFGSIGALVAVGLWQLAALGPLQRSALPSVSDTVGEVLALLPTREFWSDVWLTILVALGGFLMALVFGILAGVLIATSRVLMHATRFCLEFLKPIPPIVILPLVVLVLGPTTEMSVFLVFYGCSLPILMQTVSGVFDVDPVTTATARSFGLGKIETLWRIVLPSTLSYIGTAIRVTVPASLIIAVVGGLLGGGPGLGNSLLRAQLSGSTPLLFAYVVVLGLLGLSFQLLSSQVQRRMLHWHPTFRKEQVA